MNRLRDMPLAAASLLIIMTGSACEQQSADMMEHPLRFRRRIQPRKPLHSRIAAKPKSPMRS